MSKAKFYSKEGCRDQLCRQTGRKVYRIVYWWKKFKKKAIQGNSFERWCDERSEVRFVRMGNSRTDGGGAEGVVWHAAESPGFMSVLPSTSCQDCMKHPWYV